jgi:hypothetical protein
MKQTAVEWLYKNLLDNPISNEDIIYNINIFEQALEMEKQQIIHAYGQGVVDEAKEILDATKDAEQYYNQKYKSK